MREEKLVDLPVPEAYADKYDLHEDAEHEIRKRDIRIQALTEKNRRLVEALKQAKEEIPQLLNAVSGLEAGHSRLVDSYSLPAIKKALAENCERSEHKEG